MPRKRLVRFSDETYTTITGLDRCRTISDILSKMAGDVPKRELYHVRTCIRAWEQRFERRTGAGWDDDEVKWPGPRSAESSRNY